MSVMAALRYTPRLPPAKVCGFRNISRSTREGLMTVRTFQKRVYTVLRAWLKTRKSDNSYSGEFAHLNSILERVNIQGGYIVDVAASDGVTQSCTLGFFSDHNWQGLAIEMDPDKFAALAFVYAQFANVKLARCRVTPGNVTDLLQGNEVPNEFTLLNLDIDSYDLDVVDELLKGGFRPRVISMEVNEKIPPPLYFTVNFDAAHYWKGDDFYGCSLTAAASVVKSYGYKLESLQFNNAMFVHESVAKGKIQDISVEEAYDTGYRNRPERKTLFPWNASVECALAATPDENLVFFRKLFKDYQGRFTLERSR